MPDASAALTCVSAADVDDVSPSAGGQGRENVGYEVLHRRWNHRPPERLRDLLTALRNVPSGWRRALRHPPSCHCDACMKGHSDKVPSRRHAPEVHAPRVA